MVGGRGGDLIQMESRTSSSERVYGEDGFDCFFAWTTSWSVLHGGSGDDPYYSTSVFLYWPCTMAAPNVSATLARFALFQRRIRVLR